MKDSSEVTFKWGKVYVEDTALGLPTREVMLPNGIPDSTGFASNNAIRDTLYDHYTTDNPPPAFSGYPDGSEGYPAAGMVFIEPLVVNGKVYLASDGVVNILY